MAFKPTPEMENALRKVLEQFDTESEGYDEDNFLDRLVDFENDYMPDDIRKSYTGNVPSQDLLDWEKFVYKDTPWKDEFNGEAHDPDNGAGNPVTSETIIDKDDDGDADVTITKQDDGDDKKPESDEPHDEGLAGDTTPEEEAMLKLAAGESKPSTELAGDTTLEEDLMLNPGMSPSEFSKKAAEKRGAKPGEPAPDFNNFTNDIVRNLASRRW